MVNINHFVLRRFFKYFGFLLSLFERLLLNRYSKNSNKKPIVFILGAPRTGSTLLYQLLTTYLDVSYIDNFVYLGRNIPFLSFLISQHTFKNKKDFEFSSSYGSTFSEGLQAPSEAGNLWKNWMPKDKYYINKTDIEQNKLHQFSNFLNAISNKTKRPTIIKNLYFSQRLRYLKATGLNCKFIFLRRNPIYTAQSIYLARKKNLTNVNEWWSVEPSNYNDIKNLRVFEQIASQVYYLETQIKTDLNLFSTSNILTFWYEDLDKPNVILDKTKKFIGSNYRSEKPSLDRLNIKIQNYQKISDSDFDKIKQEVKKLYTNNNS